MLSVGLVTVFEKSNLSAFHPDAGKHSIYEKTTIGAFHHYFPGSVAFGDRYDGSVRILCFSDYKAYVINPARF